MTGEPRTQACYEKLVKTDPAHPVLFYHAKEVDMRKGLAHPPVMVGANVLPFTDPKTGKMVVAWDTR